MGPVGWLAKKFGYEKAPVAQEDRRLMLHFKRAYAAAKAGRLVSSWTTQNTTADREIRDSLPQLRARSRQLIRDTAQGRRFVSLCAVNVTGPEGIGLQNRAVMGSDPAQLDPEANRIIEEKFKEWGESGLCSVDRQLTWCDQQSMYIKTLAADGETFTRKIREPKMRNRFGSSLQWFEADQLPVDLNKTLSGGRRIVMSIEKDELGRILSYHLSEQHPGETADVQISSRTIPIAAAEMIHTFVKERPTQSRGVPWAHAVMGSMNMRAGYQEAALVAARVGAAKMGIIETPTGDEAPHDEKDTEGNKIADADPGSFWELASGQTIKNWDPTYPNGEYDPFTKAQDREIAAGLNVSYHALTGDLNDVNYSSIRAGTLEMRDMWRFLQKFTATHFCKPAFSEWLFMALYNGQIKGYDESDFERLNRPTWEVRGWEWVDPLKEIMASIKAVEFGLSTRTLELSKRGLDVEDVFRQLQVEQDLAAKFGLDLKSSPTGKTASAMATAA